MAESGAGQVAHRAIEALVAGVDDADADPAISTLAATRRLVWLLVVPVMLLLGVLTTLQYLQHLIEAERALVRAADDHAQDLAALARPAVDHVHDLRVMLESEWRAPPDAGPELRLAMSQRQVDGLPDGWTLD